MNRVSDKTIATPTPKIAVKRVMNIPLLVQEHVSKLEQAANRWVDRVSDCFSRDDELDSPVLLASAGVIV